jgi:hypothetical protein
VLITIVLVHLGCFAIFLVLAARAPIIEDMDDAGVPLPLNSTSLDGSRISSAAARRSPPTPASQAAAYQS